MIDRCQIFAKATLTRIPIARCSLGKSDADRRRVLSADLGARILGISLRTARGSRTLNEVAERAGTAASVICDLEHGRLLPTEQKLRAIFRDGCGVSESEFESVMFDFRLDFFLESSDLLSRSDRVEIRGIVDSLKPRLISRDRRSAAPVAVIESERLQS